MNQDLYYLAGPQLGTLDEEALRGEMCLKIAAEFVKQGIHVFSPIVYSKQIAAALNIPSLEERRKVVLEYLLTFLKLSKGLILVTMDGWKKSWGVNQELKFCQAYQIPVYLMNPEEVSEELSNVLLKPLSREQINQLILQHEDP